MLAGVAGRAANGVACGVGKKRGSYGQDQGPASVILTARLPGSVEEASTDATG